MKYRLIIIWESEPEELKDIYTYNTRTEAEQAMQDTRKTYGYQMEYMGIQEATR